MEFHLDSFYLREGQCLNSLRVILFLLSAILNGNTLYRRHADAHVYMYIYINCMNTIRQLRAAGCMWCQCHSGMERERMGQLSRSVKP